MGNLLKELDSRSRWKNLPLQAYRIFINAFLSADVHLDVGRAWLGHLVELMIIPPVKRAHIIWTITGIIGNGGTTQVGAD